MNVLDQVIGFFSPEAGARRVFARAAFHQARSYEAAKRTRRTADWRESHSSANVEVGQSLPVLRARSRDLVRNNAYAAAMAESWVSNLIGTGIIPKFSTKSSQRLFDEWANECDAEGGLDFFGLQALLARAEFESGEVLLRFRRRKSDDGLAVPLQLQVLESDFLDHLKNGETDQGGSIITGVQFSAIGAIEGYWLFDRHPGDNRMVKSRESQFVPAEDVIHLFERTRPGQVRGVPRLTPVLLTLRDIDDVEDSTLMRKKIEACLTAFITSGDPNRVLGQDLGSSSGRKVSRMSPGQIERLAPGEQVNFSSPPTSSGYAEYMRTQLRKVAAGGGTTYEQATGDLSQVNYSSIRAGMVEFRRRIQRQQWQIFIPLVCRRVAARFLETANIAGKVKGNVTVTWTPPRFDWVDPVKDVTGELLEIAAGLKSWQEAVRGRGEDPDTVLEQIKADQQKFTDYGIEIQIGKLLLGALTAPPQDQNNNPPDPAKSGV